MVPRRRIGPLLAWALGLGPLVFLLGSGASLAPLRGAVRPVDRVTSLVGAGSGLVGMALLAEAFVLSSRVRWLEGVFGGLDGMYRTHHRLGVAAFGLLVLHPVALAFRFVPAEWGRAVAFVLPGHPRWAVDFGVYAGWGLGLLMVLTLTSWLSYDRWKLSHKALGLILVAGAVHMWGVEDTRGRRVIMAARPGLWWYMTGLVGMGLVGAVYKTIVHPLWPKPRYTVSAVERRTDDVIEVTLVPQGAPIEGEPGQFVFVSVTGEGLSREAHPYTLCGPPDTDAVTVMVKALGDYTRRLYERLEPGMEATLDGPYGRFDYRDGGDRQIWIAGGVGVAPFLSWARTLDPDDAAAPDVEFYYCVHDRSDAVYRDEFEALGHQWPSMDVALVCSAEEGHLHARDLGDVTDADIFMCGPNRLTQDLRRQLRARGVPDARIHFEDFEFR